MKRFKEDDKGFTLVELVIVIAIILVLAALLVPRIMGSIDDAKKSSEISDARTLASEMAVYNAKFEAGSYEGKKVGEKDYVSITSGEYAYEDGWKAANSDLLDGFLAEFDREAKDFPTGKYAYIEVTEEGNVNVIEEAWTASK